MVRLVRPRSLSTYFAVLLLTSAAQAGEWQSFSGFDPADFARTGHVFNGGPGVDGIPAMTNPGIVGAERADFLVDSDVVMGVYMNGIARAYSQALGWHHEIVNDVIGGQGISVTFCPLTGTALNFNATCDDGVPYELGVSGLLMNSNLIIYDRRDFETLIPQMIYTAFAGPGVGNELELLPLVETTWGLWKQMYPDTEVAVPGTGLEFYPERQRARYEDIARYQSYPYRDYRTSESLIFPVTTESA